ncbi:MAG: glyceraldehyde 3-phosphate dehydrogenase NAD-binding domain-containing protein [Betaproteobacteria bacterium]
MTQKSIKLAINGYGRIGRCFLRALHESPLQRHIQVVAINEPANLETIAYLTRFDSTHGVFPGKVEIGDAGLKIDGKTIQVSHEADPEKVDWKNLGIDLLIECSGRYNRREDLERFLTSGCPRVLVSHPCRSAEDVDRTIVYGFNHESITGQERIISNASCTTNALVPILDELQRAFGIDRAFITTLHSVMNDQPLIDGYNHLDLRRTRSAMQSIIPVTTGLARGVERLLPQLTGRIEAKAIRVPIVNVSALDLTVSLNRDVTDLEINTLLSQAAVMRPGLFDYSDHPSASVDFNHNPHSAILDAGFTRTNGPRLANLLIWFDNEWAFANRMLEVADYWSRAGEE